MNCTEANRYIYAHADGELDTRKHAGAAGHIDACPECGAKARHQRELKSEIARTFASERAPADLRARVLGVIDADRGVAPRVTSSPSALPIFKLWYPIAAAAVIALFFIGIQNLNHKPNPVPATFVASFTDQSEPASDLADRIYAVHTGDRTHNASLPRDGLAAAEQIRQELGYPMLRCSTLDGREDTTFVSASYCELVDCQGNKMTGGHLVYRFDDGTYISMISVPHLQELGRLKAVHKGDRDYYILKPSMADEGHPVTVTAFNCPKATHLVCVEYPPTETIDVVDPMSAVYKDALAGLQFEPVLAAR